MKLLCVPFMLSAKAAGRMAKKVVDWIQDILINLSYFGWRPSVVYLSGRKRRVTTF